MVQQKVILHFTWYIILQLMFHYSSNILATIQTYFHKAILPKKPYNKEYCTITVYYGGPVFN